MEKTLEKTLENTIGQMVAEDYRTAQVFKDHKIDFCCRGNRNIQQVAQKQNLDVDVLLVEIDRVLKQTGNDNTDFKSWPLDLLADYIEKIHHRYVKEHIPALKQYLDQLCNIHAARYPELRQIREHFNASAGELAMHMKKEELVVFPWVRKMVRAEQRNEPLDKPNFQTVKNPIAMMMLDHENEGERFRLIAELSNDYNPPWDACNTYHAAFSLLREFEEDLHRHVHLENNILFPKAEMLESKLNG